MTRPGRVAVGRLDTSSIFTFEIQLPLKSSAVTLLRRLDRTLSTAR
jgi:hypothetical protein